MDVFMRRTTTSDVRPHYETHDRIYETHDRASLRYTLTAPLIGG